MSSIVLVGAQWGDEGKGKVIDLLSHQADVVVRFGGGANAGHTLVVGGEKVVLHLLPSGVLHGAGKRYILGDAMVIDPEVLIKEIKFCHSRGLINPSNLLVGHRSHVVLPYHKIVDGLREKGSFAIGTTKRGIGPAYEAKASRMGIHLIDLTRPNELLHKIQQQYEWLLPWVRLQGGDLISPQELAAQYVEYGQFLADYMGDCADLSVELKKNRKVLFEGAQGALLDIDQGTYPYVTSSSTVSASACVSLGIGPQSVASVIGVVKAYTTRVGEGPFPTELPLEESKKLRDLGGEYGATTGRPRRCGWLDIPALRLACRINGIDSLAMTKLDVLSAYDKVKLCVGYEILEPYGVKKVYEELPRDIQKLSQITAIYEEFQGWKVPLSGKKIFNDLPQNAQTYIRRVEELVGVSVDIIGVGPSRDETIIKREHFTI